MLGSMLGHYRIIKKLGQGGMGEVYLAEDTRLKRQVALKVLPEALRRDPVRLARFKIEAEAAARLNHPNIAQIYSIEEVDGVLFITMEYVDGLPLERFFEWFIPLSDGLTHAHEHGVTHRDLKPGNVMVSKEWIEHDSVQNINARQWRNLGHSRVDRLWSGCRRSVRGVSAGGRAPGDHET